MDKNIKILIVEDIPSISIFIKKILEKRNFTVVDIVTYGEKVLETVKKHHPDLILMDIILKGKMDGIDAAEEINAEYDIPIIYLTASDDEENLCRAKKTSPYGYIIKPINGYELYSTITTALSKFETEKKIKENERKYRLLFENMTDAFIYLEIITDKNDNIIDAIIVEINKVFEKLFNFQKKEIIGNKITAIIPNIDNYSIEWRKLFSNIIKTKKSIQLNIQIKKINRWLKATAFAPDKNLIAIILEDTTEKIISEKKIKESEIKFKSITSSAHDAIIMLDNKGYVSFWNKSAERIFGYTSEEMNNQFVHDILVPENLKGNHLKAFAKWKNTGKGDVINKTIELPTIKKDGTEIIIELTVSSVKIKDKWNAIGIARDITEKKTMVEKLQKKENELLKANQEVNNLLSSMNSILIEVSIHDTITHWNSTSEKIFGLKEADVTGKRIIELKLTWDWFLIYEGITECMSDKTPVFLPDIIYTNQKGEKKFLGITINPIMDKNNSITGFLIFGNDITEKKIMQMELLQSQKLSSIGELASGIAHEINTPIQYVSNNITFLENCYTDVSKLLKENYELIKIDNHPEKTKHIITKIKQLWKKIDIEYLQEEIPLAFEQTIEGITRITTIIKSMKRFAHPEDNSKIEVDINKALEDTITISKNEWKYSSDLITDFDKENPEVMCFPGELNQVFLNIIVNSAHAINESIKENKYENGEIIIKTRAYSDYFEISISDNGTGIKKENKEKIFDPFFTTKEIGKGTGQGLSIAYSIITDKHEGRIFVESEEGVGTAFFIQLPYK